MFIRVFAVRDSMKRKERSFEYWHIAVIVLAILLFLLLTSSMTGGVWYRDYGGGGFGFDFFGFEFFNFTGLYQSYGYVIDAVIFLLIFLGLAQSVFRERFKESRGLYVGVGLFLSFALLLWEEQTGISLLQAFGPMVFGFFVIVLAVVVVRWLSHELGWSPFASGALVYLVLYWILFKTKNSRVILDWLVSIWPGFERFLVGGLLDILMLLAAGFVVFKVIAFLWSKVKPPGGSP